MLHDGDQHFIACPKMAQSIGIGHQVEALGSVAGKDDLPGGAGMEKGSDPLPGILIDFGGLHAEGIETPQGVGVVVTVKVPLSVQNALGALGGGGTVQIGDGTPRQKGEIRLVISFHI